MCTSYLLHPFLITLLLSSITISQVDSTGDINGFISFGVSELAVDEDSSNSQYTTISIPFIRTSGTQGQVAATFQVVNSSASSEFLYISNKVTFTDGQTNTNGFLIIINDATPEINQTFIVRITQASFGAELGSISNLRLTIIASDNAFGVISFDANSLLITGSEPLKEQDSTVEYQVNRIGGLFGYVTVKFEVYSGPNSAALDVSPTEGQLNFNEQMNSTTFNISILHDNIPENNETFYIRLVNPTGGAVVSNTNSQAQLIIEANDSPVRFANMTTEVSESNGTVQLLVYRGISQTGGNIGPLNQVTTVHYSTTSGTAVGGQDFTSVLLGTVTFSAGVTSQIISIPLTDDTVPEGDETFTVTLFNVSSDSVLQSPFNSTVVITINDNAGGIIRFLSTETQSISEDDRSNSNATFIIQRTIGSLGDITVSYTIKNNTNQLATSDFSVATGNITMPNGVNQTSLVITTIDDSLPEEAESFTVSIDSIVNGVGDLSDTTLRIATLYIADSDDVYGVISASGGQVVVNSGQREFRFQVIRSVSAVGEVIVEYLVDYLPPGSSLASGAVAASTGSVSLTDGQTLANVSVSIFSNAFLEENGILLAKINDTELSGDIIPLVTPTSPSIGLVFSANGVVSFSSANGNISFSSASLSPSISEPLSGFTSLSLTIVRTGGFGTATVTWTAEGTGSGFTNDDLGGSAGSVVIPNGAGTATFAINVLADDVPELNETFTVKLLAVFEADQFFANDNATANITILENDNPEGMFSISSLGPFNINETIESFVNITVQRIGGNLTTEKIDYEIIPSDDFIGGSGNLTFEAGVDTSTITLAPRVDGIPEANEVFTLVIFSSKPIVQSPSNVTITILANDDYNGVFNFSSNSVNLVIDEPANPGTVDNSLVTTAIFTVHRNVASFGTAVVYWELAAATTDVTPSNGSVYFNDNSTSGSFNISSTPDILTEGNIVHTVRLISVVGGGRVSDIGRTASLSVTANDDPISISSSSLRLTGNEGQTVSFVIIRGGRRHGPAVVNFTVSYSTASSNDVIIVPVNGTVSFEDGDTSVPLNITIVDDSMPELSEELHIQLVSVTGDVVLASSNTEGTLVIAPSDDPNGIFQFNTTSLDIIATEGSDVVLSIERLQGKYGTVTVYWEAFYVNTVTGDLTPAVPETDLVAVSGNVEFQDGQSIGNITITIRSDGRPELEEMYMIALKNITGGGAVTSSDASASTISIPENDSPYGVFQLVTAVGIVWLGEDIPTNDSSNGTMLFNVTRTAGMFSTIEAVWEIVPLSSTPLPSFTDLLLKGTNGSGVVVATPRPYTRTKALNFTGSSDSVVTVHSDLHPSGISDGSFALTVWFMIDTNVTGMILSKATSDGSTIFYGLEITADTNQYIIRFHYLPSTSNSNADPIEVPVSQSIVSVGKWHYLVVSVASNTAIFYIDGSYHTTRTLISSVSTGDSNDVLTVGGLPGSTKYFVGALQDVRVYAMPLSEKEVNETYFNPAVDQFTYVSGVVSVSAGSTQNYFIIQTKDDNIPENNKGYLINLVAVSGKAALSNDNLSLEITILKSDSSNGVFSLSSLSPLTANEGNSLHINITRTRSTFGSVSVTWEVRNSLDNSLATEDFLNATGSVTFNEGDIEKVTDETVPELNETFYVSLATLSVEDIHPSTTPTSGAWLNDSAIQLNLTVPENDSPYGILEFYYTVPPATGVISPATDIPQINTDESAGTVTVYVVRAQGTVGVASVDYLAQDGTASSGGVSPDYSPAGSTLEFSNGERFKSFTVTLVDDSTPELSKYFFVNLSHPVGNAVLGVAKDIIININPSDDAFGVFGFSSNSLSQVITEGTTNLIPFSVTRGNKGTFHNVTVYWEVVNGHQDVTPSNGSITFLEGTTSVIFYLTVNNDNIPELHENFTVRLINASEGRIASDGTDVAILTIRSSDYPYGYFTLPSTAITTSETAGTINIPISREFGIAGTVEVYYSTINSSGSNFASPGEDYVDIVGSVIFTPNLTTASFPLNIIDDSIPEIPENFYVILINATLNSQQDIFPGNNVLPAVSSDNATIIISENDNARGVFQLSNTSFTAPEGTNNAVTVSRTAGTYGEVTVSWIITLNSASSNDVLSLQGTDTVPDGADTFPLSVTVVDDNIAEFAESFSVALTSVSSGAITGSPTVATVTIPTSDDPNGAFVFAEDSRTVSVAEPDSGYTSIVLNVTRTGGTLGLTFVDYNVTSASGANVSVDISFDSPSNLYFADGSMNRDFTVRILSDDLPEIDEVFYVTLFGATGGARVGNESVAKITILANDKPYGSTVSMDSMEILTAENDNSDTSVNVSVSRSGGVFGDLQVYYNIRSSVPAALDRFYSPVDDISPPNDNKFSDITTYTTDNKLNECAVSCVKAYTVCRSFVFTATSSLCQLYNTTLVNGNITRSGVSYYRAIPEQLKPLDLQIATAGEDFELAMNRNVTIFNGTTSAYITAVIYSDDNPELRENFTVELTSLSVAGVTDAELLPVLENVLTDIGIAENDFPYGRFKLAIGQEQSTEVQEPSGEGTLPVTMTITREGGTNGVVNVTWNATGITATVNADFTFNGGVVEFADGEMTKTISINILGDSVPERDESLQVYLSFVSGGAILSNDNIVTIVIATNDNAAGVISLASNSRAALIDEGNTVSLTVERNIGQLGRVMVNWTITASVNSSNAMNNNNNVVANDTFGNFTNQTGNQNLGPESQFQTASGFFIFNEHDTTYTITTTVIDDNVPEVQEPYYLTLVSARTLTSDVGEAIIDTDGDTAIITIRASDDPHGTIEFLQQMLLYSTDENTPAVISVVRNGGSIGAVEVFYQARSGNISLSQGETVSAATPGVDFNGTVMSVVIEDQISSVTFLTDIINDNTPELSEVFVIELLSATLVTDPSVQVPLGANTIVQVTILENDEPYGSFGFSIQQLNVSEDIGTVDIEVLREGGAFGAVNVMVVATPGSADSGDFILQSQVLMFTNDQSNGTLSVEIIDDSFPEPDQSFSLRITSVSNNAEISPAPKNTIDIRILASDDPNGVFRFIDSSLDVTVEEDDDVTLTVMRNGGFFGTVTVPFSIEPAGQNDLSVVSPLTGVLIFNPGETSKTVTINAVPDSNPELDETYSVSLSMPINGGRLDSENLTIAMVTILANQNPYGTFELYASNGLSYVFVEEDVGNVTLELRRSFPSFDTISVIIETINNSTHFNETDSTGDYTPLHSPVLVEANATVVQLHLPITNDNIPEINETFRVELANVSGGAKIGAQNTVEVTILTNDNAYGQIGFSEDSLSTIAIENTSDATVTLTVERIGGLFGVVTAAWEINGTHDIGEITPANGIVSFSDGQRISLITLTIHSDIVPELNEVTRVTLTSIINNGVPAGGIQSKGATINRDRDTAVVTIQANDDPHGVIVWQSNSTEVVEGDTSTIVTLTLLREFGDIGDITIRYSTLNDNSAPANQMALAGSDYMEITSGVAYMSDRQTSTTINITILPDTLPELSEFFLVALTDVQLTNQQNNQGTSPRLLTGGTENRIDILENDYPQGLLSFARGPAINVSEDVGSLCINVTRSGGLFGTVGAMYTFTDGTATGGADYSANTTNTSIVTFPPGSTEECIAVNILNDLTAELNENFMVTLSNPLGGVLLESDSTITVTILENDDVNGVFTFSSDSIAILAPEGNTVTLTVLRSIGSAETANVYWLLGAAGHDDIVPNGGNLTFQDGQTQASFQVTSVSDGIPELYEVYNILLGGVTGGGRVSNPRTASIAIPASDDPTGLISFDTYPLNTVIIQEGGSYTFTLIRAAGLFGSVSVQWLITPSDSSTFTLTSGTALFNDGQNLTTFTVQTIQDSNPEVATRYTISLVGAGDAHIDTNNSNVFIIIPASDNVHGLVQFSALTGSVSEGDGTVDVTVSRNGGLEGDLFINFTVQDGLAVSPNDYQLNASDLTISDGSDTGTISVSIIDDSTPEIAETFTITLTSVSLSNYQNGGRNFDYAGDVSLIDSVPSLGTTLQFTTTITANDNANGIININSNSFEVNEGSPVVINVIRSAGLFGTLSIAFSLTSGTAIGNGIDYISPSSPMSMLPNQNSLQISIPTVNDVTPELQEFFSFTITGIEGGAILGNVTSATIIILPNDNPNGRVRFTASDVVGRVIDNPTNGSVNVMFEMLRLDGVNGIIDVTWEVTGPDPGMERNDILQSTLQGVLTFSDLQSNGFISVTVLASDGPEPQENFTISITAATKGVVIDENGQNALLIISQRGLPFGVISFYGQSLSVQSTQESVNLTLPLIRNEGTFGSSEVYFIVNGATPSMDVYPSNGSVIFNEGDVFANINLRIIADQLPELDETYTVTLTGIKGKAALASTDTLTSTFIIKANDSPYGTFGITDLALQLVYSGENIVRRLSFVISREFGKQGTVEVVIGITYNDEPNAGYFPYNITRSFLNGHSSMSVSLDSTTDAFLAAGAILNVSVLSVTLTSQGDSNVLPEISFTTGTVLHSISENVSNPSIGFINTSSSAIDGQVLNNVVLTVERFGLEGNIQVTWSTGLYMPGVTNGSLTPSAGTFFMGAGTKYKLLNFTATPTDPPSLPEVFGVRLAAETLSPLLVRVRDNAGTSVVEPWGLIKLTYNSYSAIEGQTIRISVSRLYGSVGDIEVLGVAKAPSPGNVPVNETAAEPIIDYPLTTLTVTLNSGVTSGDILIVLPYNTGINPLKVFEFSLTGVRRLNQEGTFTTPRLAQPVEAAVVTIIDAEGGAGKFGFLLSTTSIQEKGSPLVQVTIVRSNGTVGVVTVQLMINESRADGSTPANQIALASAGDYDPHSLATMVTFANGETQKSVTIHILDDSIPETNEYLTIILLNPQGGKAVIDSAKSTFEIGIVANDNQSGIFSLVTTSLVLDEDSQTQGTLTVKRSAGLFGTVVINWQTAFTDGGSHLVALGDLLVEDAASITFAPGQIEANITLRLSSNKVPASGDTFTLRILSNNPAITFGVTTATVTVYPSDISIYQFRTDSRSVVATGAAHGLTIERVRGLKLSSQVKYSTVQSSESITFGKLTFEPAIASVHFTSVTEANVIFNIDVGNVTIPITIITTDTIARAFYVNLIATNNDVTQNGQALVVINPPGTETDLYGGYFTAYQSTSSTGLYSVASDIKTKLTNGRISGTNQFLSTTMKYVIEEVISTVSGSGTGYSTSLQSVMADVFDLIIRNNTYSGQLRFESTLKSFAHSLLTGKSSCDETSIKISEVSYTINSTRYLPTSLQSLTFYGQNNDFLRFTATSNEINSNCLDVHFIEYTNPSLYVTPLLGSKIMVLSLQNPLLSTLTTPITYRVHSSNGDILPSDNDCRIWRYPTDDNTAGYWDSTCSLVQSSIIEQDYVECQCNLVGDFSIAVPPSYGWTLPGPISCGFVVVVMILVIILHVVYFMRIQLGTRIFIFVCTSIAIFQVLSLIDMVLAPTINAGGCAAFGVLVQLAIISQFVWMFILIFSLWMNLMGYTDGKEPLIAYIFISWGLAIAIVVATILISLYALAWEFTMIYGKVGEFCFMPSAPAAAISTAIPIVILLLLGVGILSHSCFYWSRWEDVKSLYKDTFNKREIPLLILFMVLVIFTLLFFALHLYLQQIYLFFLFFAFNVIQGIYAIVVYFGMSWHTLTWKHKHYPIKEEVEPLSIPEEPEFLGDNYPSVYGSQQSLIPRSSTDHQLESQVQMIPSEVAASPVRTATVSSKSSLKPHHQQKKRKFIPETSPTRAPLVEVSEEERGRDSDSDQSGSYAFGADSDGESGSRMDDLMFALKTGDLTYSQDDTESQPMMQEMETFPHKKPSSSEQYRLRRISIADTHL